MGLKCRFDCGEDAIALYFMPNGCACFPNDTQQYLCLNHAFQAEPIGSMELIEVYNEDAIKLLGNQ